VSVKRVLEQFGEKGVCYDFVTTSVTRFPDFLLDSEMRVRQGVIPRL
jgi:hypothetical protein